MEFRKKIHTFVVYSASGDTRAKRAPRPRRSAGGPHDISHLINAISAEHRQRRLILPSGPQADSNSICGGGEGWMEGGSEGGSDGGGREQAKDNKLRLDVDLKKQKDEPRSAPRKQTPGFVSASINILPLFSLPFSLPTLSSPSVSHPS